MSENYFKALYSLQLDFSTPCTTFIVLLLLQIYTNIYIAASIIYCWKTYCSKACELFKKCITIFRDFVGDHKFSFPLYLLEHWNNNELQNSLIHRFDIWLSLSHGSSAGAVNQTFVFSQMGLSMLLSGLCRAQLMGSKKKCPQLQIS